MAFKDTFNKMISYFDTDEVNEVEEDVAASTDNVIQDHNNQSEQVVIQNKNLETITYNKIIKRDPKNRQGHKCIQNMALLNAIISSLSQKKAMKWLTEENG